MIEEVAEDVGSAESVLQILASSPSRGQVEQCLRFLDANRSAVCAPGASSSQLVTTLVTKTLPDFYTLGDETSGAEAQFRSSLIEPLESVPGLGATIVRVRTLLKDRKQAGPQSSTHDIQVLFDALHHLLSRKDCSERILLSTRNESGLENPTQQTLLWREYVSLVAGGKITAAAGEATTEELGRSAWLADGNQVAGWLGQNVAHMARIVQRSDVPALNDITPVNRLYTRCLSFGYLSTFVTALLVELSNDKASMTAVLSLLLRSLKQYESRRSLDGILGALWASTRTKEQPGPQETDSSIGAAIGFLVEIGEGNDWLKQGLCDWLMDAQRSIQAPQATIRAVVATVAIDADTLQGMLSRVWGQWGDQLFVKHTPTPRQDQLSQILLLAAAYAHRATPMYVFTMARSSVHTHGLSNRLASTSLRSRWLGMVVGMAISQLTDKPGSQLNFESDDMETPEARSFRSLTNIRDVPGNASNLFQPQHAPYVAQSQLSKTISVRSGKTKIKEPAEARPKLNPSASSALPSRLRIVELDDDDDLIPHAKPDSDPEDDSTDPTLVNRNKPRPPVYIRDLIAYLNDTENIERRTLALQSASSLIRRKTHHGKEVSDHLDELATVIAGLKDSDAVDLDEDNFIRLRERGLRAVLVADASRMGPWLARAIFNASSDYSISQRMSMLVAVGLGGRELAGHREEDEDEAVGNGFVGKRMKGRMHEIWSSESNRGVKALKPTSRAELQFGPSTDLLASPVDRLAANVSQAMLQPLALDAADKLTGPDVLKVRKFSSRMEVEKKRSKPKANELSKIVAEAFFFPLTGTFSIGIQTRATGGPSTFTHHLLPTYVRTLALLLHAAGPSTPSLPTLTSDFWDLLLTLRPAASNDLPTLEALLFGFLTLLELNADIQDALVRDHAKELIETQEWSRMVLDGAPSGSDVEEKIRMLAAGVVLRCSEIVGKYQRRLLGDLVDI